MHFSVARRWFQSAAVFLPFCLIPIVLLEASQEHLVVDSEPSCPDCRITITKIATMGGTTADEALICDIGANLGAMGGGYRFYVSPICERGMIGVFGADGSFLRKIGGFGQGPNELGHIVRMWGSGDGFLHVFATDHLHKVVSPAGEVVRSWRVPRLPYDAVFPLDGTSLLQITIPTPEHAGLPVHRFDEEGDLVLSFGSEDPRYFADEELMSVRALALAEGPSVWSGYPQPYRIEHWSADGRLLKGLTRNAEWFRPLGIGGALLKDLRVDEEGILWTLVAVPHEQLEPRAEQGPDDLREQVDSVIEVIDPQAGRLIVSLTSDEFFIGWVDDMLYSFSEDSEGDIFINVWRVTLERPRGEEERVG